MNKSMSLTPVEWEAVKCGLKYTEIVYLIRGMKKDKKGEWYRAETK